MVHNESCYHSTNTMANVSNVGSRDPLLSRHSTSNDNSNRRANNYYNSDNANNGIVSSSLPTRCRSHAYRSTKSLATRPHWEAIHVRSTSDTNNRHSSNCAHTTAGNNSDPMVRNSLSNSTRRSTPHPCLLSVVAQEFMQQMVLNDRLKNSIEYNNVFDGQQAVDKLMTILGTWDRRSALKVGRALGRQGCFHDVLYESVLLDSSTDIYQFKDFFFYNQQYHPKSKNSAISTMMNTAYSSNNSNSDNHSSMTWTGTATTNSSLSNYSMITDDRNTITTATITTLEDDDDADYFVDGDLDDDNKAYYSATAATTPKKDTTTPAYFVNGVFTPLTHCYVPSCDGLSPCYSISCPKRQHSFLPTTTTTTTTTSSLSHRTPKLGHRIQASIDSRSTPHTYLRQREHTSWAELVSEKVLNSVSTLERKRQEAICELVYTEVNFVLDLDYVRNMWIEPLLSEDIIPYARRKAFVNTVFSNILKIQQVHSRLAKKLRKRQNDHPIVIEIGDILLKYAEDFHLIIEYGAKQHEAKFVYEKERYLNPKFDSFVEYTERHPSSHKLELNGYLTKPATRLGRYPLLLGGILRRTNQDHPDYETLSTVMAIIKGFLGRVNVEAGNAKNRFDLENIHYRLSFRRKSDKLDLKLLEPGRRIIREGLLNKRANLDASDYQVILFDHYLVVAKVKWICGQKHYLVVRRPLAIPFLAVSIPSYTPTPQRTGSLLTSTRHSYQQYQHHRRSPLTTENELDMTTPILPLNDDNKPGHPILFQHMGRKKHGDSQYILFANSQASRKPWIDQIHRLQACNYSSSPVFELLPAVRPGQFNHKKVNEVVPFQNNQLLVFAMDDGVYAGKNNENDIVRKVLHLDHVTHIHVIEEFQMLLVLADKTLWQYALTDVMNGKIEHNSATQPLGKRIQNNVPFFYVGTCIERVFVCVPKVSPLKSVITILEPCKPQAMTDKKPTTLLRRLVSTGTGISSSSYPVSSTDTYLKKIKDCYIPCEAWAVELSNTKLWITGHRGIILVDMQRTDRTQPMLDPYDKHLTFITDREKQESTLKMHLPIKRISVFRTPPGDYLVCYDEYAFYVNGKGNRTQNDFLIEWEGSSESYALAWPYVIAFESSFIEVRSAITGDLKQVIRGENIRCLQHRIGNTIYGTMAARNQSDDEHVFKLTPIA